MSALISTIDNSLDINGKDTKSSDFSHNLFEDKVMENARLEL